MKGISIIITCHNYGKYLDQCYQSIMDQIYPHEKLDIIIVDDGSTNKDTREKVLGYINKTRIMMLADNKGLAYASNMGIRYSTNELVMRLDADDWLAPDCLVNLEKPFKDDSVDIVLSNYTKVDSSDYHKTVEQRAIPLGSCMLYRRSLWEKVGGYDETLRYQEDVDFFLKASKIANGIVRLNESLWYYRQHGENMSRAHNEKHEIRQKILGHTKVLTVIPARGNSKGIARKNLSIVGGTTLIERTIKMVKDSGITTKIVVSTEDEEISNIADSEGVDLILRRPDFLSEDTVSTIPVLKHAMKEIDPEWKADIIISAQPTCPFTPPEALLKGLEMLLGTDHLDSVVSVSEVHRHPFRTYGMAEAGLLEPYFPDEAEFYLQRQERPKAYGFTGGFYIRRRKLLDDWSGSGFAIGICGGIEVGQIEGIDIDTDADLAIAKALGGRIEKCT